MSVLICCGNQSVERMGVPKACHEVVKKVSRKELGGWRKQGNGYIARLKR